MIQQGFFPLRELDSKFGENVCDRNLADSSTKSEYLSPLDYFLDKAMSSSGRAPSTVSFALFIYINKRISGITVSFPWGPTNNRIHKTICVLSKQVTSVYITRTQLTGS